MRVFVLNDAPRERAAVEEIGVEPDLPWDRLGAGEPSGYVNGYQGCDDAPVERACAEGGPDLRPLGDRAPVEPKAGAPA